MWWLGCSLTECSGVLALYAWLERNVNTLSRNIAFQKSQNSFKSHCCWSVCQLLLYNRTYFPEHFQHSFSTEQVRFFPYGITVKYSGLLALQHDIIPLTIFLRLVNQYFTNDSLLHFLDSTVEFCSLKLNSCIVRVSKSFYYEVESLFVFWLFSKKKQKQFFIMWTCVLGLYKIHFLCTTVRMIFESVFFHLCWQ